MLEQEKTTKQILEEREEELKRERIPLYSPEALKVIEEELGKWKKTRFREDQLRNWELVTSNVLGSEIPKKLLYTPVDASELDYVKDIGFSGQEPFTRGIHPNMYRGRFATLRPLGGGGVSAGHTEDQNTRFKVQIENGATGLNVAYADLSLLQLCGSDDPRMEGQVGLIAYPIDSVDDTHIAFKDIPIDKISASYIGHYPTNCTVGFAQYLVMAEERGIPWDKLPSSMQNDVVMENAVRAGMDYLPTKDVFRIQCDNAEFVRKNVPQCNFVTLNGYNLREFGTSGVTEIAVAFANAIDMLKEFQRRGLDPGWMAERIAFFWSIGNDFFDEVARLRAARRLWYKIIKYQFGSNNPRAMWSRMAAQTSGVALRREEPYNNIARAALQSLACILGGVQSFHTDSYDEAYSHPTAIASLIALRTQEIIECEAGVREVVDPLGGSFYIEALTNEYERKILDELDEIQHQGGIVAIIESGWLRRKVVEFLNREQKLIEDGKIKIVGYNCYKTDEKLPGIEEVKYAEGVREKQLEKIKKLKDMRDNEKVREALDELIKACRNGGNVMEYCVKAARVRATTQETFGAIKEAFGLWKPPLSY